MFKDAFIKLDSEQAQRMVEMINPRLDVRFTPGAAQVMIHDLPFYDGYFLTELSQHDNHPPLVRNAICNNKGDVRVLNWGNDVIYDLNKSAPIRLTDQNTADYIRFFFNYVRGRHGRFIIIDSVDDIDWREEPAPAGRKALGKMVEPMAFLKKDADGTVVYRCSIVFRDSLFLAEAHVKPDGAVSMNNEELLVEDIPVADDLFGQ